MSLPDRFAALITRYSKVMIAAMLVVTVIAGAGAGMIEQSSSLDQFQSDTPEQEKLTYVEDNFQTGAENTTTAQVIVRGDDVLTQDALVENLRLQQEFRSTELINRTLAAERPTVSVANLVATSAIIGDQQRELEATAAEFERLNATVREEGAALERRSAELNATTDALRAALETLQRNPDAAPRAQFDAVRENTSVELDEGQYTTFNESVQLLRGTGNETQIEQAYRRGTRGVLASEYEDLEQRQTELRSQQERLRELGAQLERQRASLETLSPTLDEQLETLQSLNSTAYERAVQSVLSEGSGGQLNGLAFMPVGYEPGSTTANATMMLVTHQSDGASATGTASDALVDAQLEMQSLADERAEESGFDTIVFGTGIL